MSQPIAFVTTRFKCPHCSRSRSSKRAMVEHIARCWYNPAARGCKTCEHYSPGSDGCGQPDCGPAWGCVAPESCSARVDITDGPRIHCEKWEVVS